MATLTENLVSILLASLIVLSACGVGQKLLRWIAGHLEHSLENTLISFGLGMGIVSHVLLLMGLFGLYTRMVAILLVVTLAAVGLREIAAIRPRLKLPSLSPWQMGLVGVALLGFASGAIGSLAPPYAHDTLAYHLLVPKTFIENGRIVFMPFLFFNFPFGGEMFYVLGMLLYRDTVGLVINAVLGAACALVLFVHGERYVNRKVGFLSAALFYTIPIVPWHAVIGKPDLGVVFFSVTAFFLLYGWYREGGTWRPFLAGLFAGWAASWKYTGLYTVAALVAIFCIMAFARRCQIGQALEAGLVLGLGISLSGFPWYLKNWVMAGNPVWPVLASSFGGKGLEDFYTPWLDRQRLGRDLWSFLSGPLVLALSGRKTFQSMLIGPLIGALVPLLPFVRMRSPVTRWVLAFSAFFYIAWFPFYQEGRYLLPALALLLLPAGEVLVGLGGEGGVTGRAITLAAAVWFVASGGLALYQVRQFLPVAVGWESRDDFLSRSTTFYKDIQWLNSRLPPEAVVFFSGFESFYYVERKRIRGELVDQGLISYSKLSNATELSRELRNLGVTHIFLAGRLARLPGYSDLREDPRRAHYLTLLAELENEYCTEIYSNPEAIVATSRVRNERERAPVRVCELRTR